MYIHKAVKKAVYTSNAKIGVSGIEIDVRSDAETSKTMYSIESKTRGGETKQGGHRW
jgi:hypothetical protein